MNWLIALVILAAPLAHSQTADDYGMGFRLEIDSETEPPMWSASWWGRSSFRYIVLVTPDLIEPWIALPGYNATGKDEVLGIGYDVGEADKFFFRVVEYDPTDISSMADTDNDGLPDLWEQAFFGDLSANASDDGDEDGLTNVQEFAFGTDPTNPDTDGDRLPDGFEVGLGLDPLTAYPADLDADGDGASDVEEYLAGTDLHNPDTDGDGFTDGVEIGYGFDPNKSDAGLKIRYLATRLYLPNDLEYGEAMEITGTGWVGGYAGEEAVRWNVSTGTFNRAGGSVETYGHAINDSGTVVGEIGNDAMRWSVGQSAQTMDAPSIDTRFAADINSSGWIVGDANAITAGQSGAFIRKGGTGFLLPPSGYQWVEVSALNDKGTAVGRAGRNSAPPYLVGVRWLGASGSASVITGEISRVMHISETDVVLGRTATAGFVWSASGGQHFLPTGEFQGTVRPERINSASEVVGRIDSTAIVWRPTGVNQWNVIDLAQDILDPEVAANFRPNGINDRGQIAGSYRDATTFDSRPVILTPIIGPVLLVDSNRDGQINAEDYFATNLQAPYRFWINDDDDVNTSNPDDAENAPVVSADWQSNFVDGIRDLEDFTRLTLDLGGLTDDVVTGRKRVGFKWRNIESGSPTIKVRRNLSPDGGTAYLTNVSVANDHLTGAHLGLVGGPDPLVLPTTFWQEVTLGPDQRLVHFLFEGCSIGKGELVLTIHDTNNNLLGEAPGVWIELVNVKSMYERVKVTPRAPSAIPSPFLQSDTFDASSASIENSTDGYEFVPALDEESVATVFVHGSNISYEEARWHAETAFKRLYWQGFKGRFSLFYWDTLVGPFNGTMPAHYNLNEYRAWKYGLALKNYVHGRPSGYSRHVLGHSLGNGVIASALNEGMAAQSVILMQAAMPASMFSSNAPTLTRLTDMENLKPTPESSGNMGYRGVLNSGVNATVYNIYNTNDFALGWWVTNQEVAKPEDLTDPIPRASRKYTWSSSSGGKLWETNSSPTVELRAVMDAHESFSFVSRSRTAAAGAISVTGGSIGAGNNFNVGAGSTSAFGDERYDHSGQFTRPIQQASSFYQFVYDILSL
ncbi:MAG: hypothetical protein Q8M02_13190 [Candidatus Didemnitutus sp.]|nr:hypothetical protein [Candidatus Didemnitutus sp.]